MEQSSQSHSPRMSPSLRRAALVLVGCLMALLLGLLTPFGLRQLPPMTLTLTLSTVSPTPRPTAVAYCLLPSFDQGYMENPGISPVIHCVNTGAVATGQEIQVGRYASQCYDQLSKVPCYHPCFASDGQPKPCPEGAPAPTPKPTNY